MKSGIEIIAEERQRQIEVEGYKPEHDDTHSDGALADMAACYAMAPDVPYLKIENQAGIQFTDAFPFPVKYDSRAKHGQLRRLAIAGALIAAEIDRVIRLKEKSNAGS